MCSKTAYYTLLTIYSYCVSVIFYGLKARKMYSGEGKNGMSLLRILGHNNRIIEEFKEKTVSMTISRNLICWWKARYLTPQ